MKAPSRGLSCLFVSAFVTLTSTTSAAETLQGRVSFICGPTTISSFEDVALNTNLSDGDAQGWGLILSDFPDAKPCDHHRSKVLTAWIYRSATDPLKRLYLDISEAQNKNTHSICSLDLKSIEAGSTFGCRGPYEGDEFEVLVKVDN